MSPSTPVAAAAADFVHRLFVLIKAAGVYGPENEGYRSHSHEAREALKAALGARGEASLEEREERLFFNEAPLFFPPGDAGARFMATEMRRRGVATIEFRGAKALDQLDGFAFAFQRANPKSKNAFPELVGVLRLAGIDAIRVLPAAVAEGSGARAAPRREDSARKVFFEAVGVAEQLMTRVREGREPDFDAAERAVEGLAEQVVTDAQALFELSIIEKFDEYTYAHCVNVSVYSVAIGARLGLDRERLNELGFAGLFHDVGKAKLPRELIDKPDEFTADEWRLMRGHPALGAAELLAMKRPLDASMAAAARVAFEHHLGVDGEGYPRLARRRRQWLYSRVCAIADTFDAMTSGRVYAKKAMAPDEAVRRMLQKAGSAFDPLLLRVFLSAAGVYPIGSALLLDTGEAAVVRRNDPERLLRPEVAVLPGAGGGEPRLARLGPAEGGAPGRGVRGVLDPRREGIDAAAILRSLSGGSSPAPRA